MPLADPDKRREYHRRYMREVWYPANRQEHIARVAKGRVASRERARGWLDDLKSRPCPDCGGSFPPEAMDFDHVRGQKLFGIAEQMDRVSLAQLKREVEKCEVVCSNCHRVRTRRRANGAE